MEKRTLEERYQDFKWEVLGDSVDEDWQGLWEPLWYAKTIFPQLSQLERERLAERALRELFDDGLILFFPRAGKWPHGELEERLIKLQSKPRFAGACWRTFPLGDSSIWFGGTEAGERAVRDHRPGTSTPLWKTCSLDSGSGR